jgi:hypothetical protein
MLPDWDETRIIEAEPGDYLTIARKAKEKDAWFIGAITDENSRNADIPLDFLENGKNYLATIYHDADDADWQKNPEAYSIERFIVDKTTTLRITLAPGGGAAISIVPATASDVTKYKKSKKPKKPKKRR